MLQYNPDQEVQKIRTQHGFIAATKLSVCVVQYAYLMPGNGKHSDIGLLSMLLLDTMRLELVHRN